MKFTESMVNDAAFGWHSRLARDEKLKRIEREVHPLALKAA